MAKMLKATHILISFITLKFRFWKATTFNPNNKNVQALRWQRPLNGNGTLDGNATAVAI